MHYIRNKYSAFISLFRTRQEGKKWNERKKKAARINLSNSMKFPHMPLLPRSIVVAIAVRLRS